MYITRRISWHMAHRIYGYDGLCGTLHGHTYSADISLSGPVDNRSGMICDFGELKKMLTNVIDGWFDHSVFLWEGDPLVNAIRPLSTRMVVLSGHATAENLAQVLFGLIDIKTRQTIEGDRKILEGVRLARIRLWETENSSVEVDQGDDSVKLVDLVVGGQSLDFKRLN